MPAPVVTPLQKPEAAAGVASRRAPAQALVPPHRVLPSADDRWATRSPPAGHRFDSIPVQAKLAVGAAGDHHEQEADRVADAVMRLPQAPHTGWVMPVVTPITPHIARQVDAESDSDETVDADQTPGEEVLQAKRLQPQQMMTLSRAFEHDLTHASRGGESLPARTRAFFEPRFGHDFGHVRVHADGAAAQLARRINAHAFTRGGDIFFGAGRFQPDSDGGRRLLAHELTHTVQQGRADPLLLRRQVDSDVDELDDEVDGDEREASPRKGAAGRRAGQGDAADAAAAPSRPPDFRQVARLQPPAPAPSTPTPSAATVPNAAAVPDTAPPVQPALEAPARVEPDRPASADVERVEPVAASVPGATAPTTGEAPAEVETAATPEASTTGPALSSAGSPGALLNQLSAVVPSRAAAVVDQARTMSAVVLERQRDSLQKSMPQMPVPTGLPAQQGGGPRTATAARGTERPPRAPDLPVPAAAAEPARDTQDSPPRPVVDLTGAANPRQMSAFRAQADAELGRARAEADEEVSHERGESDIRPTPVPGLLKAGKGLSPPLLPRPLPAEPPVLDPRLSQGLDASLGPPMRQRIGQQRDEYLLGEQRFDADVGDTRRRADADVADLQDQARGHQRAEQTRTRTEVRRHRSLWRQELDQVTQGYREQAEQAGSTEGRKIADEKNRAETRASAHLADAERQVAAKQREAGEEERREKERAAKSGGFLDWAKAEASAVIDLHKKALGLIFDNLRKAVKGIVELTKNLVKGIIEASRRVIVGLIQGFGLILKLLLKTAFAAFPQKAAKYIAWIDAAVSKATQVVDTIAAGLGKAVTAVLDGLSSALDKLLGLVQSLYNAAFTVIGMLVRGEFKELMQRLGNLVEGAQKVPELFEIAAYEELLGGNLDEPLSPAELAMAGKTGKGVPVVGADGPANGSQEEYPRSPYTAEKVGVDHVDTHFELSDELTVELVGRTGGEGEIEIAESADPRRSIDSVIAEAVGPQESRQTETAKRPDDGLTPMQRAEVKWTLMKQGLATWWQENKVKVIAGAIAAIVGVIALIIVTGGAILGAVAPLMSVLGPILLGASLVTLGSHVADYVSKSWQGDIRGGGKSLAKGLAAGAVELISLLTFKAGGLALKGAKIAATGVAAAAKGAVTAIRKAVVATAEFVIGKGKLLFRGIADSGIGRAARRVKDLGERLLQRLRFKKFRLRLAGLQFVLEGFINPWVPLASGKIKKILSPKAASGKAIRLRKGGRPKTSKASASPTRQPFDMSAIAAKTGPAQMLGKNFSAVRLKPGQDALYILRDVDGTVLKVGKTSAAGATGRFSVYKRAGKLTGRELELEVHPLRSGTKNAEFHESALRGHMESKGHALPWDNTGQRLGRPGFGTPGEGLRTPPVTRGEMSELLRYHKGNLRQVGKELGVHRRTADLWAKSLGLIPKNFK